MTIGLPGWAKFDEEPVVITRSQATDIGSHFVVYYSIKNFLLRPRIPVFPRPV